MTIHRERLRVRRCPDLKRETTLLGRGHRWMECRILCRARPGEILFGNVRPGEQVRVWLPGSVLGDGEHL